MGARSMWFSSSLPSIEESRDTPKFWDHLFGVFGSNAHGLPPMVYPFSTLAAPKKNPRSPSRSKVKKPKQQTCPFPVTRWSRPHKLRKNVHQVLGSWKIYPGPKRKPWRNNAQPKNWRFWLWSFVMLLEKKDRIRFKMISSHNGHPQASGLAEKKITRWIPKFPSKRYEMFTPNFVKGKKKCSFKKTWHKTRVTVLPTQTILNTLLFSGEIENSHKLSINFDPQEKKFGVVPFLDDIKQVKKKGWRPSSKTSF